MNDGDGDDDEDYEDFFVVLICFVFSNVKLCCVIDGSCQKRSTCIAKGTLPDLWIMFVFSFQIEGNSSWYSWRKLCWKFYIFSTQYAVNVILWTWIDEKLVCHPIPNKWNSWSFYSVLVLHGLICHYSDVIMNAICSSADLREHQSSASLAFVRGIHWWPVASPHKGPMMGKLFPFDDIIMVSANIMGLLICLVFYQILAWTLQISFSFM